MDEKFIVYTLDAVANRMGKKPKAVKQKLFRLRAAGQPLELGDFVFHLIGSNGYIAFKKGQEVEIFRE